MLPVTLVLSYYRYQWLFIEKYQKANCPRDKRSLKLKEEISLLYFSSLEREDLKALSTGSGKAKIYGKVIVKGNLMFEL